MFKSLIGIKSKKPASRRKKLVMSVRISTESLVARQGLALRRMTTHLSKVDRYIHDFADLRRLKKVVSAGGLNKSLMAFANPKNGGLSKIVKSLPATESLDLVSVGPLDPRAQKSLEEMDATLGAEPGLVADWVRTGGDNICKVLESTEETMKRLGLCISHYLEELENASLDDDKMSSCTVAAMPYDAAHGCISALLDVLPDLDITISDPTDKDAMDAHAEKMASIVDRMGEHTGVHMDPSNRYQVNIHADLPDSHTPTVDTLETLGYTKDNVIDLLKKADALVDEINGLIARKKDIVSCMDDAADKVASMDNDVPPAVDMAISPDDHDMDDDMDDTDCVMTQADMVHCQTSSHMCCITAACQAATSAVQNVLSVALCYDQLDTSDPAMSTDDDVDEDPDDYAVMD